MKTIIIIGTGYSGSSAIHDFITQNTIYKNPLEDQEFRILDDPDGILNLYNSFYKNPSVNNFTNAIIRFENYVQGLKRLKKKINDKKLKIYKNDILSITNLYIKQITKLRFSALPQFLFTQAGYLKKIQLKLKGFFFNSKKENYYGYNMYLPVEEKVFIKNTKKYILKMIKEQLVNNSSKNIILEQAINIFNFEDVFKFFDDVKIIIVTRDPRDIYYSMKSSQSRSSPCNNVKTFTKWYEFIIEKYYNYKKNINHKVKKSVLEIKFESFILDFSNEKKKLLKFIEAKEIKNKYSLKNSKKNVFISKNKLTNYEKKYIEKNLKKYLLW